jgi:osmotically-inducible protein OsmY
MPSSQVPKVRSHWRLALMTLTVCGMVACTPLPPRSAAQKEADDATTQRVEAALAASSSSDLSKVTVSTYDGVVHLGGLVWSSDAIYAAARVAGSVAGVKKVSNSIELESSQTPR